MTFNSGTKLGTYEIISPIGVGGMGEVYRARDSKLKRDVAIKVLPETFSRDAERVARFQREAEVLASLNHPHIAAIYDLANFDESRFLVLELVEGATLADRIARGSIPKDEALAIAKQIAEALEAAHEKGIIHRDLKPANIKITPDGKVKVLDFGLAKAFAASPGDSHHPLPLSQSPTMSLAATNAGIILGTAAYMSPEQAKGQPLDRRTDIFAFGCVLYEMLTGQPAFGGENITEILSRVLQRDPDWTLLPRNVSPRVQELLRLCLQKDVKNRRSDAADVRIDIEQALSDDATVGAVYDRPAGSRERVWMGVAAVFLIATAALAFVHFRESAPAAQAEMRSEITTPVSSTPLEFALSPDGIRLAFVALDNGAQRLWVRPLSAVAAQPLPGTDGADFPFWSPDSRALGFFANGKLKRIEVGGGPPQTLADASLGRGGAWNQDDIILFAPSGNTSLSRISANGGTPVVVTHLEPGQNNYRFPQFLPDGRHFLYYAQGPTDRSGIYLGSLDGSDVKRLVAADTAGAWTPPDWLLYMQQGILRAQRLDIPRGTLTGNPVTVADPVGYSALINLGGFSVSAAGMVAYRSGAGSRTQLTWFDRTGKTAGTVGDPDQNGLGYPELSPDGRRVAVDRTVQGNQDIWVMDLLRGGAARFTFDAALDRRPLWSPDGTQMLFQSNRKGAYDLYAKPSSGTGAEQLLLESPGQKVPYGWSADGHFLLYGWDNPKTDRDLWALPMSGANASPQGRSDQEMQGDRKPVAIVNSAFYEGTGQFSPDGRWVAYISNESGRFEIFVVPFPAGGGKWQISTSGGVSPRWRHDGKELFFIGPDGQMMAATVSASGTSFEAAPPLSLFQTRIVGGGTSNVKHQYAVSADGRFLINVSANDSTAAPITLLQNWKPPAK